MRLLKYSECGELTISADLVDEATIPPYAILSHRWGEDTEELAFEDVASDTDVNKFGCKQIPWKIQFCGEQARRDGLQHFWVDTCCIDNRNKAEHAHAIQSMFRWYRNAARCYVYLSDVSCGASESDKETSLPSWDFQFRRSKWFLRGWTLQELLAPSSVHFFSREGNELGDKISLKQEIHETTGIPALALEGTPLSQFDIDDRLRWKGDRETKREEDAWYSLAGIFNVEIAPAYSKGVASAFRRLTDKIKKLKKCIRDIRYTDLFNNKKRIEETKGGLLVDSYR